MKQPTTVDPTATTLECTQKASIAQGATPEWAQWTTPGDFVIAHFFMKVDVAVGLCSLRQPLRTLGMQNNDSFERAFGNNDDDDAGSEGTLLRG